MMDTEVIQEVWYANVKHLDVHFSTDHLNRDLPLYDDMDMTESQYTDYKRAIHDKIQAWQGYFNDVVFSSGIPLPYWPLEMETWFQFYDGCMHVVADLYYNIAEE